MIRILKFLAVLFSVLAVSACDPRADLSEKPKDLGPFLLGHNVVVARNPSVIAGSIPVTEKEWQVAITGAIDERFGESRYNGDRLYHIGISVDGFFLTRLDAGVPVVPSLKSLLHITVTLWDDALGRKLNPKAEDIFVISSITNAGSFPTKAELIRALSGQAALEIQEWLQKNPDWFTPPFE